MQGKIVKGISGFYYVHVVGTGIYECKAKGVFRNRKALVIFAAAKPDPNFNLLDRFLCMMEYQKVPVTI